MATATRALLGNRTVVAMMRYVAKMETIHKIVTFKHVRRVQ